MTVCCKPISPEASNALTMSRGSEEKTVAALKSSLFRTVPTSIWRDVDCISRMSSAGWASDDSEGGALRPLIDFSRLTDVKLKAGELGRSCRAGEAALCGSGEPALEE